MLEFNCLVIVLKTRCKSNIFLRETRSIHAKDCFNLAKYTLISLHFIHKHYLDQVHAFSALACRSRNSLGVQPTMVVKWRQAVVRERYPASTNSV